MFLVREDFFKNINPQLAGDIKAKLNQISNELLRNNFRNMRQGSYVRKMEGCRGDIYKVRLNIGDRVLFTYGDCIKNIRENFRDYVIFLDYCTHDKQELKAKKSIDKINIEMIELDKTEYILTEEEKKIDNSYRNYYFDIENDKTFLIDDECYADLLNNDNKCYLYYLNNDQYDVLQDQTPLILKGSAGSGKTTVGIYKLIQVSRYENNIAYFTYTSNLRNNSKNIFDNYRKNKNDTESNNVKFYILTEFCIDECGLNYSNLVNYEKFKDWYERKYDNSKLHSIDVWTEIRGIIKGFMGLNWIRDNYFSKNIISKDLSDFLLRKGIIKRSGKDEYYLENISVEEIINIFHSSGIKNKSLLINEFEVLYKQLVSKNIDKSILNERVYINLPLDYSIYDIHERNEIYKIAIKYQEWLKENNYFDENDIALMTIKAIKDKKIEKFKYIVVDEIQDLTGLQIYMIFNLLENKNNLFLTGDFHQIINPTYFSFGNLKNLFYVENIEIKEKMLFKNYRSQENIVQLCKDLSEVRKKYIGNIHEDYTETFIRKGAKPFILKPDINNLKKLLDAANQRSSYVAVIVPDEEEKQKLKQINCNSIIFTIQEIKGLEYQYVICCNMISKFALYWEDIFNNKGRKNSKYRYYFNILYVALTRAKDNICIYEDTVDNPIINHLRSHFKYIDRFDENELLLLEISDISAINETAKNLERNEKYLQAMELYRRVQNIEGEVRCKACILANKGEYEKAGDLLVENKLYKESIDFYEKCKNFNKAAYSMIYAKEDIDDILKRTNISVIDILKYISNTYGEEEKYNILLRHIIPERNKKLKKQNTDMKDYIEYLVKNF